MHVEQALPTITMNRSYYQDAFYLTKNLKLQLPVKKALSSDEIVFFRNSQNIIFKKLHFLCCIYQDIVLSFTKIEIYNNNTVCEIIELRKDSY